MDNLYEMTKSFPNVSVTVTLSDLLAFHEQAMKDAKIEAIEEEKRRSLDRILTPAEAAKILGVSVPTIMRYAKKNGLIPYIQKGRFIEFHESDILEYRNNRVNN